jgi:hypothetical protein
LGDRPADRLLDGTISNCRAHVARLGCCISTFSSLQINVFLTVIPQAIAIVKAVGYGIIGLIVLSFFIKGMSYLDSRLVIGYLFWSARFFDDISPVYFQKFVFIFAEKRFFSVKC